jgi:hypothetical protein
MSLPKYLARAFAVQCAVSLFSCSAFAQQIPAGLSPEQLDTIGTIGIAGLVAAFMVLALLVAFVASREFYWQRRQRQRVCKVVCGFEPAVPLLLNRGAR